jgi:hypothetical protein
MSPTKTLQCVLASLPVVLGVTGCGDSSATGGSSNGGAGPAGGNGSGASSSDGGGGGGTPGDCVPPASAFPHPPPATCLPGPACAGDSDCPAGSRCNTELSPPQCEDLYCGGPGTFCSDDVFCEEGLECAEGLCSSCDLCGTTLCSIDFMNDPQHCGCCNNPALPPSSCTDGVIQCPAEDPTDCESIWPFVVGYAWTYSVELMGAANPGCSSGTHVSEVLMSYEEEDRTSYEVTSSCGNGSRIYSAIGDSIELLEGSSWATLFAEPIEEGSSWTVSDSPVTWHEEGTVVVAAGTFERCWRAAYDDVDRYDILCRGVGPVRRFAVIDGNGYDIELVSKNF